MKFSQKGFSLIEVIVYIGVLSFISIIVINSFIVSFSISRIAFEKRNLLESGNSVLDRISREIRNADSIVDANSVFDSSDGVLELSSENGARMVKFQIDSGKISFYEDDDFYDFISGDKVTAESIIFRKITTSASTAVKIEMILKDDSDRVVNFYNTVILRGSY